MIVLRSSFAILFTALLLTGCQFYPNRLFFEGDSAFLGAWPIMFGLIEVNGSPQPYLGKGNADVPMPAPVVSNFVTLTIPWVEYHSGASWQADIQMPIGLFERWQNTININVIVGRNGAIEIFRVLPDTDEDVSFLSLCATRTPAADASYGDTIRYFATLENWEPPGQPIAPLPLTPCKAK